MPLKSLIYLTIGVSLLGAIFPECQKILSLSWAGIERLYLWQFVTYPFVEPNPLSFSFFLALFFNMYVLWMFGSSLIDRCRPPLFFVLYFGATLLSGGVALLIPHSSLAGSTYPIYALLIAWMMLNREAQLVFFSRPLNARWLILVVIGISLFLNISSAQWAAAAALSASLLFGYLFVLIAWRQPSPFPFLRPFERTLLRFLEPKKKDPYQPSKIYDIHSGKPVLDDEQFMDAMLDRISRHGEESLTPAEKQRMKQISERKK